MAPTWKPDPGAAKIDLAPGYLLPKSATITAKGLDELRFDVVLHVTFDGETYECDELRAVRRRGGAPVTLAGLRDVPIARLIHDAIHGAPRVTLPRDLIRVVEPDELEKVATTYKVARAAGEPPTQKVADELGITRSNASRKVMKARAAGLIEPAKTKGE